MQFARAWKSFRFSVFHLSSAATAFWAAGLPASDDRRTSTISRRRRPRSTVDRCDVALRRGDGKSVKSSHANVCCAQHSTLLSHQLSALSNSLFASWTGISLGRSSLYCILSIGPQSWRITGLLSLETDFSYAECLSRNLNGDRYIIILTFKRLFC